ncbi:MAG TPA: hypothetical protein VJL33_04985 [Candidatus Bathyarchaeia archaeon]|nr:hypothetical protein [Candidatus Bathyarchaeia archaeon]
MVNEHLVKQLLEQIQQSAQEPKDIGKVSIINVMLWMKNNAYEPTTIKRVAKELKTLRTKLQHKHPRTSQNFRSKQTMQQRPKRKLNRILRHSH